MALKIIICPYIKPVLHLLQYIDTHAYFPYFCIIIIINSMRVRQRDAEREMHYIDLFTHRPPSRFFLLDDALTKSPAKFILKYTNLKDQNAALVPLCYWKLYSSNCRIIWSIFFITIYLVLGNMHLWSSTYLINLLTTLSCLVWCPGQNKRIAPLSPSWMS
jgi:hypothetical protein